MKKYLSGLITGMLITLSLGVFATELNILPNPYPIFVNEIQTVVEGYNINGFTFLKLADFRKTGLVVKFNETEQVIEITSSTTVSEQTINNLEVNTMSLPTTMLTPDGVEARLNVITGKYIVFIGNFTEKYYKTNIKLGYDRNREYPYYIIKNGEIVIENLETLPGYRGFDYDYYCNTILSAME